MSERLDFLSNSYTTLGSFGESNTTYYAQSFTAVDTGNLAQVSFALQPYGYGDDVRFHALITTVADDGYQVRPDMVLFESGDLVAPQYGGRVTFSLDVGSLQLAAGQSYAVVLDAAVLLDGIDGVADTVGGDGLYSGGQFFYRNIDSSTETRAESFAASWSPYGDFDMGLNLVFGPDGLPSAAADFVSAGANDGAVVLDVLANDIDPDTGDTLIAQSVGATSTGTTTSIQNGQLVYDPGSVYQALAAGETATETFTYTIADTAGALASATVTVTVVGENDPPQAWDDYVTISQNDGTAYLDVLGNDIDPDNGDVLSLQSVSGTNNGLWAYVQGNQVAYDLNTSYQWLDAGETATDTFTYEVGDSSGAVASATVTVTIVGENDAPVLYGASFLTIENGTEQSVGALLAAHEYDPDHSALFGAAITGVTAGGGSWEYSVDGGASWAAVADVGESSALLLRDQDLLRFAPDGSGALPASLTVRAWDQTNGNPGEMVDASQSGGTTAFSADENSIVFNHAPVASVITGDVGEDGPALTLTALVSDADLFDPLSFSIDTSGTLGRVTSNGDGTFSYDPGNAFDSLSKGQTATDSFTYTVYDAAGASSTEVATVTVHGANDAPTLSARTDTLSASNSTLSSFGESNTAYYAQSFTAIGSSLTNVSFALAPGYGQDLRFHALVTDVLGTSGALLPGSVLFESGDLVLSQSSGRTTFSVDTGSLHLTAGHIYGLVLDAKVDFDGVAGTAVSVGGNGINPSGEFFYHNIRAICARVESAGIPESGVI